MNNIIKKTIIFVVLVSMLATLAACTSKTETKDKNKNKEKVTTEEKTETEKEIPQATSNDPYIDVDISDQRLIYYVDGQAALVSDIVTGTPGTENETPQGEFSVCNKMTGCTLTGADYVEYCDYWIGFIGVEFGFHDKQSRTEFGGDIYLKDGSHGCVNMPLDKVEALYNTVSEGTPVYVHE